MPRTLEPGQQGDEQGFGVLGRGYFLSGGAFENHIPTLDTDALLAVVRARMGLQLRDVGLVPGEDAPGGLVEGGYPVVLHGGFPCVPAKTG
jgi:hypothetical protein